MPQIETDVVPDNDSGDGPPVSHQILCDLSKRGIKALPLFVHAVRIKEYQLINTIVCFLPLLKIPIYRILQNIAESCRVLKNFAVFIGLKKF